VTMTAEPFKDAHRELQELVRELVWLRNHNRQFQEGDPQDNLLLYAEGAIVLIVLERFVRIVLGDEAGEKDTLHTLLQKALSKGLLRVPWDDQQDGVQRICDVRNALLHGNYEQIARKSGCASVAEFFKTQFASLIQRMFEIVGGLMQQIDRATGKPRGSATG
jgi:hypothetical protein